MKVNNLRAVCIIQITIWQLHHSKCSFFHPQARAKKVPNLKVGKFLSALFKGYYLVTSVGSELFNGFRVYTLEYIL